MAETAKAAVFVGAKRPLEVQEFPIPEVEPGAALLRMEMAAICGTDVHAWHLDATPFPVIFGHENLATVAMLGAGVEADVMGRPLREGDRVIFRDGPCGACPTCAMGNGRCSRTVPYGFVNSDAPPHLQGGFGQYIYLRPRPWLLRVPDEMSTERAILAVVGNHTALNGVESVGGVNLSDTVVIQGSGPIGMGALNQVRMAGAGRIIVIGAPRNRLAMAEELGATDTIDIAEYPEPEARVERVMELTRGQGPDLVVEASGGLTAFQEGLEMVKRWGRYLVIGQWTDYGPLPVNPSLLTHKSIRINGVYSAGPQHIIRSVQAMNLIMDKPVEKLITHRYTLETVNEGFAVHESMEAMIPVILPNG